MKPRKVFVVDDSKLMHQMYTSMFDDVELLHAFDGLEGLSLLAEHRDTELVVLDINMPRMNGLEFLAEAKQDPRVQAIPVVIVSTEGSEEDTVRGLQAGAAGYVQKPFDAEILLGLVDRLPSMRAENA